MQRVAQATAYSTQAPGDRQAHNQRQAGIFNSKTEVFTAPLPEDVKQASDCHPRPTSVAQHYWKHLLEVISQKGAAANEHVNMLHSCRDWLALWMLCHIWGLTAESWMWVVGQAA